MGPQKPKTKEHVFRVIFLFCRSNWKSKNEKPKNLRTCCLKLELTIDNKQQEFSKHPD